jgi:hypothetical protein
MTMENKFPLLDSGRKNQIGCFAGIPGTGAICAGCIFLVPDGSKSVCAKYHRMMERKGKPISGNTPACRYFKPRRMVNSTMASDAGNGGGA